MCVVVADDRWIDGFPRLLLLHLLSVLAKTLESIIVCSVEQSRVVSSLGMAHYCTRARLVIVMGLDLGGCCCGCAGQYG